MTTAYRLSSSHGTLIIAVPTSHGTYLAADSRGTSPKSDSEYKLFKCGTNALVGITGHLTLRANICSMDHSKILCSGQFHTTEILRELAGEYTGDGSDLSERISVAINRFLKPFWDCFIVPAAEAFMQTVHALSFCEIPILTWLNGSADISVVRFPFTLSGRLLAPISQKCSTTQQIQSWGENVEKNGFELKDDSCESVLEVVKGLYSRAMSLHPDTIGGPIDIGVVDENGARWVMRKEATN